MWALWEVQMKHSVVYGECYIILNPLVIFSDKYLVINNLFSYCCKDWQLGVTIPFMQITQEKPSVTQ